MSGHLQSRGLYIQRRRLIEALHNIDPVGDNLNVGILWYTEEHTCSVPGPNSLWHIDGHHSLIRRKIVVHGGIDGYSRLIVYLHASTNNRGMSFVVFVRYITRCFILWKPLES